MDKVKLMLEELRVLMFGDKDGFALQAAEWQYLEYEWKARKMENWTPGVTNRVKALRAIAEKSLLPWPHTSTLIRILWKG